MKQIEALQWAIGIIDEAVEMIPSDLEKSVRINSYSGYMTVECRGCRGQNIVVAMVVEVILEWGEGLPPIQAGSALTGCTVNNNFVVGQIGTREVTKVYNPTRENILAAWQRACDSAAKTY